MVPVRSPTARLIRGRTSSLLRRRCWCLIRRDQSQPHHEWAERQQHERGQDVRRCADPHHAVADEPGWSAAYVHGLRGEEPRSGWRLGRCRERAGDDHADELTVRSATPADPFTATTDADGHFSATFTSPDPGQVTGHASSTLADLGNVPNGNPPGRSRCRPTARARTAPTRSRRSWTRGSTSRRRDERVSQPHTFTAFVEKNLGDGGWVGSRPANEPVTITLTNRTVRRDAGEPVHGNTRRGRAFLGDVHVAGRRAR